MRLMIAEPKAGEITSLLYVKKYIPITRKAQMIYKW